MCLHFTFLHIKSSIVKTIHSVMVCFPRARPGRGLTHNLASVESQAIIFVYDFEQSGDTQL